VPIIMLTATSSAGGSSSDTARRQRVLAKPVSGKALLDRMVGSWRTRAMVKLGDYYGPEPRKLFYEPIQKMVPGGSEKIML